MQRERILIVEAEIATRLVLSRLVADMGHEAVGAADIGSARERARESQFDVALLDLTLPDGSGLGVLDHLKREAPDTVVIIMTSNATVDTAIEALRKGAYDYLRKPFELNQVSAVVARAIEKRDLSRRNRELVEELDSRNRVLTAAVKRLASLNAAGLGMSGIQSIPELLEFFLDLLVRELNIDRASVMLLDEGLKLRIVAARGIDAEVVKGTAVEIGEGVAGTVVKTGQAVLVMDVDRDLPFARPPNPRLASSFVSVPIVLSVPIKSPDAVMGAINVTNRVDGRPFDQDDVDYLRGLAGQVAVAIERARHLEQLNSAVLSLQSAHEQLLSAERLKILGELAAGVAHDFNNTLNAILGRAQLLCALLDEDRATASELRRGLELIEQLSRQGAVAVQRIQDSARIRKDHSGEGVDLNAVVRLSLELTEPKWRAENDALGRPIDVALDLGEVPLTTGTRQDISQVLTILILNAIDAMPDGGRLTLRTSVLDGLVHLEVADTGTGMSDDVKARIFEPFFTTKEDGHGLGLSIAYGIMTRMGGTISVDAEPGQGTRFSLLMPVHEARQEREAASLPRGSRPVRSVSVLVIEDELVNRELCREILDLHGHQVTCAASGAEGLAVLDEQSFDVVLTDLSMPGMSGWDVAREVHRRAPGTPVMVLSGWGGQLSDHEMSAAGISLALAKPVEVDALLDAIQRVLEQDSAAEAGDTPVPPQAA